MSAQAEKLLARTRDGTIDAAHTDPRVLAMWERYAAVCDYVPLHELAEAREMFARFEPIDPT